MLVKNIGSKKKVLDEQMEEWEALMASDMLLKGKAKVKCLSPEKIISRVVYFNVQKLTE